MPGHEAVIWISGQQEIHLSPVHGLRRQRSRLEKPGGPQPLVQPDVDVGGIIGIGHGVVPFCKRSTFPPSTACAANDRVLKNRAAHSHLSNLTWTLAESSVLDMASCLSGRPKSASAPSKEGLCGQIHRNRRSRSKLHDCRGPCARKAGGFSRAPRADERPRR